MLGRQSFWRLFSKFNGRFFTSLLLKASECFPSWSSSTEAMACCHSADVTAIVEEAYHIDVLLKKDKLVPFYDVFILCYFPRLFESNFYLWTLYYFDFFFFKKKKKKERRKKKKKKERKKKKKRKKEVEKRKRQQERKRKKEKRRKTKRNQKMKAKVNDMKPRELVRKKKKRQQRYLREERKRREKEGGGGLLGDRQAFVVASPHRPLPFSKYLALTLLRYGDVEGKGRRSRGEPKQ